MHLQLDNERGILDVLVNNEGGLITASGVEAAVSVVLTPEQIKELATFLAVAAKESA